MVNNVSANFLGVLPFNVSITVWQIFSIILVIHFRTKKNSAQKLRRKGREGWMDFPHAFSLQQINTESWHLPCGGWTVSVKYHWRMLKVNTQVWMCEMHAKTESQRGNMGSHFRGHLKITANSASTEDKKEKWTGMVQLVEKGEQTDAATQKSSGEERANSPSHVQGVGSQRACHPNSSWISFGAHVVIY